MNLDRLLDVLEVILFPMADHKRLGFVLRSQDLEAFKSISTGKILDTTGEAGQSGSSFQYRSS